MMSWWNLSGMRVMVCHGRDLTFGHWSHGSLYSIGTDHFVDVNKTKSTQTCVILVKNCWIDRYIQDVSPSACHWLVHQEDLELMSLQGEWFLLEWLDAGLPQLDPIWGGLVNDSLAGQCGGQCKDKVWIGLGTWLPNQSKCEMKM